MHGRFSSHGVPDESGFGDFMIVHEFFEVESHGFVSVDIAMRGLSVVSLVEGVNGRMFRKLFGDGKPVVGGTVESV